MNPALQQGFIQLIYSTWLHNADAIGFFVGACIAILLLFRKPTRTMMFFFVAFVALLVRFEYLKHIVDPLEAQTVGVVVTQDGGFQKTRRGFDLLFNDVVPVGLYLVGWGSMFVGMILSSFGKTVSEGKKVEK